MGKINNILIMGSLPKTEVEKQLYETITKICSSITENISSPIDTTNFKWTDAERYERAFQKVHEADLVIWEQSNPSTGQWMEIRECDTANKPLIVLAKEWSTISGLVKWCPATKEIIYYTSIEDLQSKLFTCLSSLEFHFKK